MTHDTVEQRVRALLKDGRYIEAREVALADAGASGPYAAFYLPKLASKSMLPVAKQFATSAAAGSSLASNNPLRMLVDRVRVPGTVGNQFDTLFIHVGLTKVFITLVKDDIIVNLEDDASMFPSDNLVTAIRMLVAG